MRYSILLFLSIFLILSICPDRVFGQNWKSYCELKADSLKGKGIDTIIYYQTFWSASFYFEANKCCMIYDKEYLFWKNRGKSFIMIYSDYYNMQTEVAGKSFQIFETMDKFDIFPYLYGNLYGIWTSKVLPAITRTVKDSVELVQDYGEYPGSHPGYAQVTIFTKQRAYQNGFCPRDLTDGTVLNVDGSFREKWESLNYEANSRQEIYILAKKLDRQIELINQLDTLK